MPSIGKLSHSAIRQLFLGPVAGLTGYNYRQVKSLARTLGFIATGETIVDIHAEVQAKLQDVSNNGTNSGESDDFNDERNLNNEDEEGDFDEDQNMTEPQQPVTPNPVMMPQASVNHANQKRVANRIANQHKQFESSSVNSSTSFQESMLLQFIYEKKAEKLADELGFSTVMQNRRWGPMEKKDCETIKDLAMAFIKVKVLLGDYDETINDIVDKALKAASKRLVEHMVGEISWQAASFVGEAENPMLKAANEALKAYNGSRRDYKRKLESTNNDNNANSSTGTSNGAPRPPKQLVTCYNCREVGHISKNCPKKNGTLGNDGSH